MVLLPPPVPDGKAPPAYDEVEEDKEAPRPVDDFY
jgi:hypothetical protein